MIQIIKVSSTDKFFIVRDLKEKLIRDIINRFKKKYPELKISFTNIKELK